LVFGEPFVGSAKALAIITGGQMIYAITGPLRLVLIMSGHENKATLSISIGGAIYLLSNIALIQLLGINGAAIAFTITWAVTSLLNLCFVLQMLRMKFLVPRGGT